MGNFLVTDSDSFTTTVLGAAPLPIAPAKAHDDDGGGGGGGAAGGSAGLEEQQAERDRITPYVKPLFAPLEFRPPNPSQR